MLTLRDFQLAAREKLSTAAWEYLDGGAGDDITVAANRAAFDRTQLNPRVLVDVSKVDTSLQLLGMDLPFPVLLAPAGYHKLFHPEGELETVKGANASQAHLFAACFSTVSYADMAAASTGPLSFQLYFQWERDHTRRILDRVLEAGCASVCVTVDVPVNGPRDRELHAGFCLPEGTQRCNIDFLGKEIATAAHRPVGRNIYAATRSAKTTWKDLEWLRSLISVPLLLKGVLNAEDAKQAEACGCDGVIVSNHGGRSIDTAPATLDVLQSIRDSVSNVLLLDGGIRRGTDIFKALARGANAVLIGRPYLHGLSVAGADGIAKVVEILRTELEMTMALTGCPTLTQITPTHLKPALSVPSER